MLSMRTTGSTQMLLQIGKKASCRCLKSILTHSSDHLSFYSITQNFHQDNVKDHSSNAHKPKLENVFHDDIKQKILTSTFTRSEAARLLCVWQDDVWSTNTCTESDGRKEIFRIYVLHLYQHKFHMCFFECFGLVISYVETAS